MFGGMITGSTEKSKEELQSYNILENISKCGKEYNDLVDFFNVLEQKYPNYKEAFIKNLFYVCRDIHFRMEGSRFHNDCRLQPVRDDRELDDNKVTFEKVYLIWEDELNGIMKYNYSSKSFKIEKIKRIKNKKICISFDDNNKINGIYYNTGSKIDCDSKDFYPTQLSLSKDEDGKFTLKKWGSFSDSLAINEFYLDEQGKMINETIVKKENIINKTQEKLGFFRTMMEKINKSTVKKDIEL